MLYPVQGAVFAYTMLKCASVKKMNWVCYFNKIPQIHSDTVYKIIQKAPINIDCSFRLVFLSNKKVA